MHDVSWPFGRRDMYHAPADIPVEARHEYSSTLGIPFDGNELIDGGFRSVGQYAIATHEGGPRNGVLTAVEDFLAGDAGQGWQLMNVPVGYGLAILYRPHDGSLPPACREHLNGLRAAIDLTGGFLESCEANFLTLYLYSEHTRYELEQQTRALNHERGAHFETLEAYRGLEEAMKQEQSAHQRTLAAYEDLEKVHQQSLAAYQTLDGIYRDLSVHVDSATQEYGLLQSAYDGLLKEYQDLLGHYRNLQHHANRLAATQVIAQGSGHDHQIVSEMAAAENGVRE